MNSLTPSNQWLVPTLRQQAIDIAKADINGWGNTMTAAADEIEALKRDNERLRRWIGDAADTTGEKA